MSRAVTIIDLIPTAMVDRFARRLAHATGDRVLELRATMIADFAGLIDQQTAARLSIIERDELVADACKETRRRSLRLLLDRIEEFDRLFEQGGSAALAKRGGTMSDNAVRPKRAVTIARGSLPANPPPVILPMAER